MIGAAKQSLDTPALLVELDLLDANIARIAAACARHGVRWRPHIKGQKIPQIVRRELAGGGVFSDVACRTQYHLDHPCALTILTTVTSRPTPTRIVCDAGKNTMSGDAALPEPIGVGPVASARLSAEHGIVELKEPSDSPRIGETLEFVVGYSDTTVHLHEEMYALRQGRVFEVRPVLARGKLR